MIKKTVLNNGIRVLTECMPNSLSASIGVWITQGSRDELPEANGIAHFIEHLLFKGTSRRTAHDIAREIDSIGGVLNAFTSREYVCYYAKVLHNHLPDAMDLLADIFINSTFDPDEVEKERAVILQEISMLEDTPDDRVHDLFTRTLWQNHPLGLPIVGSEATVGSFSRDYIHDYWRATYLAGNVIVAAAGQVDHDQVVALVKTAFSAVSPGVMERVVAPLPLVRKRVAIHEKDLEQVHVCLGLSALPHNHERRYEALLLNTLLGGSMSSRLFQEIREKRGLVYSIYSYLSAHSDIGALTIYAGTGRDNASQVIGLILEELQKIVHTPLSVKELNATKEQLKGNILLSLESSDNRMSKLAKNEIYYGGYLSLDEIEQGLDAVTVESFTALGAHLVRDDQLNLVVLGPLLPEVPDVTTIRLR
jgi:predicted Zn-dependent peptidase